MKKKESIYLDSATWKYIQHDANFPLYNVSVVYFDVIKM